MTLPTMTKVDMAAYDATLAVSLRGLVATPFQK